MRKRTGTYVRSTIIVMLLLLGAFFVVATNTVSAAHASDYNYTISNNNATITGYTGTGGAITIPSTLGGYPVVAIGNGAFSGVSSLTFVSIPSSVLSIGDSAFKGCTNITSVTIQNGVTSINYEAFYGCSSLTSVTIPSSVTSIGIYAFTSCPSLTGIYVDPSNANYAHADGVLYNRALTTLVAYPGGDVGAFTIPSGVISIGYGAFFDCSFLTLVAIPDSVTLIGDLAFGQCTRLTFVAIGSGATSIGYQAFTNCYALTSMTLGDNVTTIGDLAFLNCTSLSSMTFLGVTAPTTVGANWISGTPSSLRGHAYVDSNFPSPGNYFNGLLMGAVITGDYTYMVSNNNATIIGYTGTGGAIIIPSTLGGYPVVAIGDYAFSSCSSLTSVTIPNNVTSIGYGAFFDCSSLTLVAIPNSVKTIGDTAFDYCTSLTSVTIPNGVTIIGQDVFNSCTSLISATIPNSVTIIRRCAFNYCSSLTSMTIPNNVTSIGDTAFDHCSSLTSVTIPNRVISIGQDAFQSCYKLTSVTIPSSLTSIGMYAFSFCTSLTAINVDPDNPNYASVNGVLYNKALTTLIQFPGGKGVAFTIPSGVTTIGAYSFGSCASLTSVSIPDSVQSIGKYAFCYCSPLTSMTFLGLTAPTTVGANWISGTPSSLRGHAYVDSNFPALGEVWNGLTMGVRIGDQIEGDYAYRLSGSPIVATIIGYYGAGGAITIPSTLGGYSVMNIGAWAFANLTSLYSVTIPNSVASIGDHAFTHCFYLTSVTIPNSVTSIGDYAFQEVYNSLYSVIIPDSVISIGNFAFEDCESLTSLSIGSNVTSIGSNAFASCFYLKSVTIPNSVTSIGDAVFEYCIDLTSISIGSGVTFIGERVFNGCSLTAINVNASNANYASVDGVLYNKTLTTLIICPSSKTNVIIPNSVTSIRDLAFFGSQFGQSITFLSLVAPTSVGDNWKYWNDDVGHAYAASNFPPPGNVWNGLMMGAVIPGVPGPPTDLHAAPGNVQVKLNWTAPISNGDSVILNYNVYRSTIENGTFSLMASLSGSTYDDTNLTIGQTYWYKVSAVNAFGEGPNCSAVNATPYTVPNIPNGLAAIPGNAHVKLNWTVPSFNGYSIITGYHVYRSSSENGTYSLVSSPSGLNYNDTGLTNGQTYWYEVSAVNAAGEGATTTPTSSTPFTIPNAPIGVTAIAGNAQVTLNWTAPGFDGGRNIDYYVIYQDSVALPNHLTNLTDIITGLTNGQSYSFTVAAHNLAGIGVQSSISSATPITIANIPTGLTAIPGNTYVTLNWTAPTNNGGSTITNYDVYRGATSGSGTLLIALGNVLTYRDTSPSNGQTYYYSVSAINAAGESNRTQSVIVVPGSTSVILSIRCDASTAAFGFGVQITGNATHLLNGIKIAGLDLMLYYSVSSGVTWNEITSMTTDANGNYSAWWTPAATGYYLIRADWAGNSTLDNSSAQVSLSVIQYSNNYVFSVESNSTVTVLSFNSTSMELSFTVSGPPGTMGYTRIMISKELVVVPENVKLLFDNDQLNYTVTERTDSWILMFTYHHSSHHIVAELTGLAAPSAPFNLMAIPGNGNITLSWSAPMYSNASAVTGYLLSYGNATNAMTNHIELNQLTYIVAGLLKGQTEYFEVAAKNSAGWGPNCTIIQSVALGVPDAPGGMQEIPGNVNVTLNWTAPSYLGSGSIIYHLFRDGAEIWNGASLSYVDRNVSKGVEYSYKVSADNEIGWGQNCTAVYAIPYGVPDAPMGMTAIAGHELVDLNWTAPLYAGPGVLYYHLFRNGTLIWNGTTTSYEDVEVTNGVTYSYNVAANNSVGWGLNSTVRSVTPFGAPSVPIGFEAFAGDGNVTLNWTTPSYVGPGTIVYHLFRNGSEIWNGIGLTYHDNVVINSITYSYQLAASNSVGRGPNCTAVQATPQPIGSIPMAPIGLTVIAGNLQVDINWTVPSYVGVGMITYHVFRDGALVWSGIATNHRDTGLSNGHIYEYKVTASNAIGWGPNCTAEFATPSGVPDTPWGLAWEAGNSQVALSWKAVNYSGPGILIYHLFRDGVEVWNGTSIIYIDTGLINGHQYEYNVVASNSFGWGLLSATVKATPIAQGNSTLLYIGIAAIVVILVAVLLIMRNRKGKK